LTFAGKQLQDACSLHDYGIEGCKERDCTLYLSGLLDSGRRLYNGTSRSDAASIKRTGFRESGSLTGGGIYFAESISDALRTPQHATSSHPTSSCTMYHGTALASAIQIKRGGFSRELRNALSDPAPVPQDQTKPCIAPAQLQSKSKAQRHPERPAQLRGKVSKSEMRRRLVMRVQQPRGNYIAQTGPGYGGQ
jgi:hypothetical protein